MRTKVVPFFIYIHALSNKQNGLILRSNDRRWLNWPQRSLASSQILFHFSDKGRRAALCFFVLSSCQFFEFYLCRKKGERFCLETILRWSNYLLVEIIPISLVGCLSDEEAHSGTETLQVKHHLFRLKSSFVCPFVSRRLFVRQRNYE